MRKFILSVLVGAPIALAAQNAQIDLPITWDDMNVNYTVDDFGGNVSQTVADPMNASNTVLESVKTNTAATWAGTSLCPQGGSLATAIPFAQGATTISLRIYSPDAGIPIRLKAEDHTDPTKSVETEAQTQVANAWDTLVFDFANEAQGTAAINFTYTYDKLSVFYNFNTDGATAGTKTYYLDDAWFGGQSTTVVKHVTFRVDMNNYTGSFTTPEVNGSFNGWCGNCNPMTDADQDGIWEVTLPLTADSIDYKFSHDNWTGQESLTPGATCTKTINGNTNRFVQLTGDVVLPAVCWEDCAVCQGTAVDKNVTFQVDLNGYSGAPFTNVNLNGTFNGWCGTCATMTDADNDSIYDITLQLPDGNYEFKYTLDGWTTEEVLTPGMSCTQTSGGFTNRSLPVANDTVLAPVCWESCAPCATQTPMVNVMFQVDLSQHSGTYSQVNLNGTFNGWCGTCAVMTDADNDSIFELMVTVPADTIEYKFTLDGWTVEEVLSDTLPCTWTEGGFTNRMLVPHADTTLAAVCWEACAACGDTISSSVDELAWNSSLVVSPNPANTFISVSGELASASSYMVRIIDIQGRTLLTRQGNGMTIATRFETATLESGMYFMTITADGKTSVSPIVIKH